MTAWKKRLLPASFRGIPFFVDSHELSGGRKVVGHEPTDRDTTFSEDTGIKSKTYTLEGHVLGDDYFFIRDALESALDNRGEGVLIHPYLGPLNVRPGEYSITESTDEGRIARFTLSFIDVGQASFPIAAIDAITSVLTSVVSAIAQVQNAFQVFFKVAGLPGHAVETAERIVQNFFTDVRTGISNVRVNPEKQAAILKKIDDAEANVAVLVQNPASLAAEIDSIVGDLSGVVEETADSSTIDTTSGRDEKISIFDNVVNFLTGHEELPENTPTREQEKVNSIALENLIVSIGISRLGETAALKTFETQNDALSARETISTKITERLVLADDETFQGLKDLNAKLIDAIPNPNENLATVNKLQVDTDKPSLVLTYDVYESADFEDDIIRRNKIRNPGFINGSLEVLSG